MDEVPDCPACGGNSAVTAITHGDTVTYRCAATYAHDDRAPRFWTVTKAPPRAASAPRTPRAPRAAGSSASRSSSSRASRPAAKAVPPATTAELTEPLLGVMESLPTGWIEHGVIEYRFRQDHPELFGRHVADAGHVLLRDGASSGTTASGTRFATALFKLEREGKLTHYNAVPTGAAWQQDRLVGYWAVRPKPPKDQVLTWEDYATGTLERPDGGWTDEDRAEVARLASAYGRRR
jgi:hypothetical protein